MVYEWFIIVSYVFWVFIQVETLHHVVSKEKKYISINPESRPGFYPGIPDFSVGIGIQVGSGISGREEVGN